MLYVEVSPPGYYAQVPEEVAQAGNEAVIAFAAANPDKVIDATDPSAPSVVVEAEKAKLWLPAEVAAESALAAAEAPPAATPDEE